ncbi:MAG: calcium-binding protein, partial [Halopseudomonas aestusnigri]
MARFEADTQFDIADLSINRLYSGFLGDQFINNVNETVQGYTFEDLYLVAWAFNGGYNESYFAGSLEWNGSEITGGTVTGYLETGDNANWIIAGVSVSALAIINAAQTTGTSDDYRIISKMLSGDDTIKLSNFSDRMYGYSGNDKILGYGGDDFINGNSGNDLINGGSGHDILKGGSGNDTLKGGSGIDILKGGSGNDTLIGGGDEDVLVGGGGADTLKGGGDEDILVGGGGTDTLKGGGG